MGWLEKKVKLEVVDGQIKNSDGELEEIVAMYSHPTSRDEFAVTTGGLYLKCRQSYIKCEQSYSKELD